MQQFIKGDVACNMQVKSGVSPEEAFKNLNAEIQRSFPTRTDNASDLYLGEKHMEHAFTQQSLKEEILALRDRMTDLVNYSTNSNSKDEV